MNFGTGSCYFSKVPVPVPTVKYRSPNLNRNTLIKFFFIIQDRVDGTYRREHSLFMSSEVYKNLGKFMFLDKYYRK
jgi:hypothetical protein